MPATGIKDSGRCGHARHSGGGERFPAYLSIPMTMPPASPETKQADVQRIARIPIIQNLMNVVAQTTGMGFVGVARVTESQWIACAVRDSIGFGLKPGDELRLESTICNEIRQHGEAVVIDHVAADEDWCRHHTPLQYGFQSYISFPIRRRDGTFFGTLCAIDPQPRHLNVPAVTNMFALFADLISFHLETLADLDARTEALDLSQSELQAFGYVATHDLQEPLRKIRLFTDRVLQNEPRLSDEGRDSLRRVARSALRMQKLVRALVDYPLQTAAPVNVTTLALREVVEEALADLASELRNATVSVDCPDAVTGNRPQWHRVFLELLRNAVEFTRPGVPLEVRIRSRVGFGRDLAHEGLAPGARYCHIEFADNGIGIPAEYRSKVFGLFQRLRNEEEHDGYGLGLSIVSKILGQQGGLITAGENGGGGTCFHIYVPAV
ncbi:MAG: GAF domain-containing sensor histidine kinase [Chitinophagaceae bacterium]|nr:MAG: GAF domain-containing sensor histidine kinase [Chitinophagaceae bacterium]